MANPVVKLGEILVKKGWIDHETLAHALREQVLTRDFLGHILLKGRKISEEQLAMALSEQSGIPFIRLTNFYVDWNLVMEFSAALILDRKCFPLRATQMEVTFAIANILDERALAQMESERKGYRVKSVLVTQSDMNDLLERYRQYVNIKMRRQLDSETA